MLDTLWIVRVLVDLCRVEGCLEDRYATTVDLDVERVERLDRLEHFTDADVAFAGDVDEDALTRRELEERLDVPLAAACGDEAVALRIFPGACLAYAEGRIEVLPVPGSRAVSVGPSRPVSMSLGSISQARAR